MQTWIRANWRRLQFWLLLILATVSIGLFQSSRLPAETSLPPSQYASTITAPFNQPSFYPIGAAPPADRYRPVSEWLGRLILPTAEQYQQVTQQTGETDWAWLEVTLAPTAASEWIGKTVRLSWQPEPIVQAYVQKASRDVQLTPDVLASIQAGNIHPERLNGRKQVGPLQSLAGGHPFDDVTIALKGTVQSQPGTLLTAAEVSGTPPTQSANLRIQLPPIQEIGRYAALVKLIAAVPPSDPQNLPQQCPGDQPCPSDRMQVRHYNPATRQFDGPEEVIRIPQQPADWIGVFNMTTRDLVTSPAGEAGWYVYGAPDATGLFTVQAMQPRSLFQLKPQQTMLGVGKGQEYINFGNWRDTPQRKGTVQSVLADPAAKTPEEAQSTWKVGDRALVMHLFGGRGGTSPTHESSFFGTYAGHFAFGWGQVIQDPFTQEPRLQVDYFQVYGKNVEGILSGGNTWMNYMGNLQRGWMGTRPVSDVLIKLGILTQDYDFGGTKISFFNELLAELNLMGDRYRIGDGSGGATITPATSCVQDSNQALFMTIRRMQQRVMNDPTILAWLQANPDHPTTQNFQQLVSLGKDLAEQLMPMGVVRSDWKTNANILTGVQSDQAFISIDSLNWNNIRAMLLSWRTALPRQSHDELALLLQHYGGKLWFLRTSQIGGDDPGIAPIAPTLAMGEFTLPFTEIPIFSHLLNRIFGGMTIPNRLDWLQTFSILGLFSITAGAIGFSTRFLVWQPWIAPWYRQLWTILRCWFVPALSEEFIFRVLLLPYPKSWIPELTWWSWAAIALGIYVLFHIGLAKWQHQPNFRHPVFLILIALLGFSCILTYRFTGSLWTITFIHWVVVSVWLLLLGRTEKRKLHKAISSTSGILLQPDS